VVFGLSPALASAACFTNTEWRAAHVRILQTELQVAALECANVAGASYNDEYTQFIARFQDRLKANATTLKAHFQRVYGGDWGRQLDIFVTKVANEASDRSMQDMKFCANSAGLFQTALSIEKPQFEQAAIDHVTDHDEVGDQCPAKPAVQAAAKPAAKPVAKPAGNAG
jgi:hypothetical protein